MVLCNTISDFIGYRYFFKTDDNQWIKVMDNSAAHHDR